MREEKSFSPVPMNISHERRNLRTRDGTKSRNRCESEFAEVQRSREVHEPKAFHKVKKKSLCEENYMFNIHEEEDRKPSRKKKTRFRGEGPSQFCEQRSRGTFYRPQHEPLAASNHESARQFPNIHAPHAEQLARRGESRMNYRASRDEDAGFEEHSRPPRQFEARR